MAVPTLGSAHRFGTWLFAGLHPGRPLHPSTLGQRLRRIGIHTLPGRRAALMHLAAQLPVVKPDHTRRYQVPAQAARTMSALGVLRDQVIAPILAGIRSPRPGRRPAAWTQIDRDYETVRIGMQTLFEDLRLDTAA